MRTFGGEEPAKGCSGLLSPKPMIHFLFFFKGLLILLHGTTRGRFHGSIKCTLSNSRPAPVPFLTLLISFVPQESLDSTFMSSVCV